MGSLIKAGDAHGTDSEVDLFLREIGQATEVRLICNRRVIAAADIPGRWDS